MTTSTWAKLGADSYALPLVLGRLRVELIAPGVWRAWREDGLGQVVGTALLASTEERAKLAVRELA